MTPFTSLTLPALGAPVRIAYDTTKPTGERFVRGESAMVAELVLATDGTVYVGARTKDGRVLRASFCEAFDGLTDSPS